MPRRGPALWAALAAFCLAASPTSVSRAITILAPTLEIEEIGADGALGEQGESARAAGTQVAEAGEEIFVLVTARGGRGGSATREGAPAGDGGGASLGPVFGASSGEVLVQGVASGGQGGPEDPMDRTALEQQRQRHRQDKRLAGRPC